METTTKRKRNRKKNDNIEIYCSRLPIDLYEQLAKLSKDKGMTINKVVIMGCRDYLNKEST